MVELHRPLLLLSYSCLCEGKLLLGDKESSSSLRSTTSGHSVAGMWIAGNVFFGQVV